LSLDGLVSHEVDVSFFCFATGFSGEKDAGACLAIAGAYQGTTAIHLTRAPHERAATITRLQAAADERVFTLARVFVSFVSFLNSSILYLFLLFPVCPRLVILLALSAQQVAMGERVPLAPIVDGGDIVATVRAALDACRDRDQVESASASASASPASDAAASTSGRDSSTGECAELVLVCGSFYILADVRRAIGLYDEIDAFDLHERMHTAPTPTAVPSASEAASSAH
jgi:hypothetical protein